MASENVCPVGTSEDDLIWKKVFADVIKGLEVRSCWIKVGPKSNDKRPYKRRDQKRREEDTQRSMPCEDEDRE